MYFFLSQLRFQINYAKQSGTTNANRCFKPKCFGTDGLWFILLLVKYVIEFIAAIKAISCITLLGHHNTV